MCGVGGGTSLCGSGGEANIWSWLAKGLTGAVVLKKTAEDVETGTVWKAADLGGGIVGCTNFSPPGDETGCSGDRSVGADTPVGKVYPVVPVLRSKIKWSISLDSGSPSLSGSGSAFRFLEARFALLS